MLLLLLCIMHAILQCESSSLMMRQLMTENKGSSNAEKNLHDRRQNNVSHHKHHINHQHLKEGMPSKKKSLVLQSESEYSPDRGIVLCAGTKMVDDALDVIEQTRNVFNSSINFGIMHCDELSASLINKSFNSLQNVQVVNMCNGSAGLFNMTYDQTKKRLRTWFCKTAALVLSPFKETMVVDIDVVFFKKPDLLFNSPAYKRTGTLYFRDRIFYDRWDLPANTKRLQHQIEDYIMTHSLAINGPYKVSCHAFLEEICEN